MGAKGFVQLALRTGQYKTINVSEVYDGELIKENRMTGEILFDNTQKKSEKIIGYVAYISLLNGFEKSLYMSVEQIEKHNSEPRR
jgi:recombination protein RecT